MTTNLKTQKSYSAPNQAKVTIGTSATLVLAANRKRVGYSIQLPATAANVVWLGLTNGVSIGTLGHELPIGGQAWDQGEGLYLGPIYGIASTNTDVFVIEKQVESEL